MKYVYRYLFTIFAIASCFIILGNNNQVKAGNEYCTRPEAPKCWATRTISEATCNACDHFDWKCSEDTGILCQDAYGYGPIQTICGANAAGTCLSLCASTKETLCGILNVDWACDTSSGNCSVSGSRNTCVIGKECTEAPVPFELGCCGSGDGSTGSPGPGTPTPPPPPPPTPPPPEPDCTAGFGSPSYTINAGEGTSILLDITSESGGTISRVDFSSSNGTIAGVTSPDSNAPFTTLVSGLSIGSATVTADAVMSGTTRCSAITIINVLPGPSAWWQVRDSDVLANGELNSKIPTALYFNLVGDGEFPGVAIYRDSTSLTTANVSATSWLANSSYTSTKSYNSSYFINAIPSEATINALPSNTEPISYFASGGTDFNGYYYYMYDASSTGLDFNLNSAGGSSIGGRKVILIVKGANLNISGNINLTKGQGFFLAVTSGNINVNASVGGGGGANLEGIYVADGTFNSGTGGAKTDSRLWIRGTVATYTGLNLQRDLGYATNQTTPAELFDYAPDQDLLFPTEMSSYAVNWREVAP